VNSFVSVLNQNVDNLKSAKSSVKDLRAVAKDLKQAVKSGDEEAAASLREEFGALQSQRDEVAARIETENRELSGSRSQTIQVGNERRERLSTDEVRFSASSEADLSSVDGINAFLESSKTELDDINSQIKNERQLRKEVRQINKGIRSELNSLGKSSDRDIQKAISDIEEAGGVATSVATQIGSQATLEDSILSNVEQSVANDLLQF